MSDLVETLDRHRDWLRDQLASGSVAYLPISEFGAWQEAGSWSIWDGLDSADATARTLRGYLAPVADDDVPTRWAVLSCLYALADDSHLPEEHDVYYDVYYDIYDSERSHFAEELEHIVALARVENVSNPARGLWEAGLLVPWATSTGLCSCTGAWRRSIPPTKAGTLPSRDSFGS